MKDPLKSVFKINKKPYDVYLGEDEITWTPQSNGDSGLQKKAYSLPTRSLPMRDVIGALIRKKKSPKKSNNPGKLLGLTVFTYCKAEDRKLEESRLSLESDDLELCQLWMTTINEILKELPGRPQKLKVFINPHSKKGKAPVIYKTLVEPLFRKAGINTDVITTEKASHAWEFLSRANLESYDGIVCVGGDGIVHEVVNGLLEKQHLNAGIDLINEALPNDFEAVKLDMRIGIIPAGSTDVIVSSAQGTNDPVTSAIHIILGHCQPLDICSLENANRLIRFSFSAAYGFLGDVLKSSEHSRWMGPSRYKWAAVKRMCKLRSYEIEINYLLSTDKEYHPRDNQRCRTGCEVCSKPDTPEDTTEEWRTFKGHVTGVSLITLPSPCDISPEGPSPCCHLGDGYTDMIIVRCCTPSQMYSHVQRNFNSKDQFDFDFVEVSRVKQCHVRAVTEYEYQQINKELESGTASCLRSSTISESDGNDRSIDRSSTLPQSVVRSSTLSQSVDRSSTLSQSVVRSSTLPQSNDRSSTLSQSVVRSSTLPQSVSKDRSIGVWNVDGELMDEPAVLVRVHRKLITVFGQGIADAPPPHKGCFR